MSREKVLERRPLAKANKEMVKALEQTGANLGMQDHFERGITYAANQFGVQSKDLQIIGEFEIHHDDKGKKTGEKLLRVFHGFPDPNPDKDKYRKYISFDEALRRQWKPAR